MKLQTYPPGYDTGEEQVTLSDLQSHARTLLAVVERMEHESGCYSHKHCGVAGCNHPPWAGFHHMQKPTYMHEFEPGKCTCRISELRRGLEVSNIFAERHN